MTYWMSYRSAGFASLGLMLIIAAGPVSAQTSDPAALLSRIEFLERQVRILSDRTAAPASDPRALGPSDPGGSPAAARLSVRISELEQELRALTGRVEEMSFQVRRVNERLDRISADLDYRMGQQSGAAQPPAAVARPPQDLASGQPATPPREPGGGSVGGPVGGTSGVPRALGTVPLAPRTDPSAAPPAAAQPTPPAAAQPTPPRTEPPAQVTQLPQGTPREQYALAFSLMQQNRHAEAQKGFQDFLDRYPNDTLAENASYWLGETYYAQGDYTRAASTFLATYEKHKTGAKAPDTLLKLGMALGQLKKNREACATFQELGKAFPNAPTAVKSKAAEERKRLGCT